MHVEAEARGATGGKEQVALISASYLALVMPR